MFLKNLWSEPSKHGRALAKNGFRISGERVFEKPINISEDNINGHALLPAFLNA
ncbi:MAG TPA: hypothetical protein VGP55_11500 [Chitinophagaceae bacterium]|nr:hypothetical protein [Chitinophagaceae bacterium]